MKTPRTTFVLLFLMRIALLAVFGGVVVLPKLAAADDIVDYDVEDVSDFCDDEEQCDVYTYSVILDSTSSLQINIEMESYTDNDDLYDIYGYAEGVAGDLYADEDIIWEDSDADPYDADELGEAPISLADGEVAFAFPVGGYLLDEFGDDYQVSAAEADVNLGDPEITSVTPPYAFVGTSGTITINGNDLITPFLTNSTTTQAVKQGGGGTGFTVTAGSFGSNQGSATYDAALTATTGNWNIDVSYSLGGSILIGVGNGFTVGDPTPSITTVNPSSWNAGQSNIPVTISGSYFGSAPDLAITGNGVSSYSIVSHTDDGKPGGASISAKVTLATCAPNGTATITVTSTGYNGTGFVPAYTGQSDSGSSSATIVASVVTGSIKITSADLETNVMDATLTGSVCASGSLDMIANGVSNKPQTAYNNGASVGPGAYNVPLNRPNMPADTYSSLTGIWNYSATPAQTTFTISDPWWVQGMTQHTQYNTPSESKCSATQGTAFIYNPSGCTWSSSLSMSSQFISQTELNGSGTADKSGHGLLHAYGSQCTNFPTGASKSNSFYSIKTVTGSCGSVLSGTDVATYPNPKAKGSKWNCGDDLLVVNSSNKNVGIYDVQDYCPACASWPKGYTAHVDHYNASNACSLGNLAGNWAADTH